MTHTFPSLYVSTKRPWQRQIQLFVLSWSKQITQQEFSNTRPGNNENGIVGYKPSPKVPLSVPVTSVSVELEHSRCLAMLATEGSLGLYGLNRLTCIQRCRLSVMGRAIEDRQPLPSHCRWEATPQREMVSSQDLTQIWNRDSINFLSLSMFFPFHSTTSTWLIQSLLLLGHLEHLTPCLEQSECSVSADRQAGL